MFFKERWLWMDEVCSYVLLSDHSLAHAQQAIVGAIDANPPLFIDVYWLLGHGISLQPLFLRAVTAVLFATAIGLFYRDITRVLGRPVLNFVVVTLFVAFTYLNYTLSTQVRSYSLLLLLFWLYFFNSYQLTSQYWQPWRLGWQLLLGTALAYAHNFGLLYVAILTGFFGVLGLWSGRYRAYGVLLAAQLGAVALWALGWYRNFRVQALAGQPHSWIKLPTWESGIRTVADLLPTPSAHLEAGPIGMLLPTLRVVVVLALLVALVLPRARQGYAALMRDAPALLVAQAGFVAVGAIVAALVASFTITSVFLNRYLWPVHLLFGVVVLAAVHHWLTGPLARLALTPWPGRVGVLTAYALVMMGFVTYQNRKITLFRSDLLPYLAPLNPRYPVFYESANYFMPIWYQHMYPGAHFLLDWPMALRSKSLDATVFYHIMSSLRSSYQVGAVVPLPQFTAANYPHFYLVDEPHFQQMNDFIARGQVQVVRVLPTGVNARILECRFVR
ncbi:MAG: hypothetical protein EOO62_17745 [Hymenobacter sp.]|nr:MAG: hypothetical protein EOO62_17745 [Hymenobacter sp.]